MLHLLLRLQMIQHAAATNINSHMAGHMGEAQKWIGRNTTGAKHLLVELTSPMIPLAPEVLFECIGMELIVPFHRSAFLCISSGGSCNTISRSSAGVHHFCEKCGAVSGHLSSKDPVSVTDWPEHIVHVSHT